MEIRETPEGLEVTARLGPSPSREDRVAFVEFIRDVEQDIGWWSAPTANTWIVGPWVNSFSIRWWRVRRYAPLEGQQTEVRPMNDRVIAVLAIVFAFLAIVVLCATWAIVSTVNADKGRRELDSCYAGATTAHEIRVCQGHSS